MPLREDQVVVIGIRRIIPVIPQVPGHEHGQQVGRGHARGWVTRPSGRARAHGVDPQLLSQITGSAEVNVSLDRGWCSHHVSRFLERSRAAMGGNCPPLRPLPRLARTSLGPPRDRLLAAAPWLVLAAVLGTGLPARSFAVKLAILGFCLIGLSVALVVP
jgi:hypothetical protein